MPFSLAMPKLSPTMEEGNIVKWYKKEGDFVSAGELLLEIATDKASIEFNALDEGWLRKIVTKEGNSSPIGKAIAIFSIEPDESIEFVETKEQVATKENHRQNLELLLGSEEPSQEEGPAKTAMPSEPCRRVEALFVPEPPLEHYHRSLCAQQETRKILASPLAKKIAKEKELDLTTVRGSGPNGRIMSRDLERALPLEKGTIFSSSKPQALPGSYEEISLSPMRKAIGRRMQEAKNVIPHFYVKMEIDAARLLALRQELKVFGLSFTINDFIIKAVALALSQHPPLNRGFHGLNQTVIDFKTIDIAVATKAQDGVITPIIRCANAKTLREISFEVRLLANKAKLGQLQPQEYKGGSFTISNLGMYGVSDFQAIVNPPQAAILAVGAVEDRAVVRSGSVIPGKMMTLTLSVDHRVVDGAEAAEFLQTIKKIVENPAILLIDPN